MTAEHTETRREEAVCGSGVQSDGHRGEYLRVPLRVRAVSISSVLAWAIMNLQRKCKKCLYATERLSRSMWHVLVFAGVFNGALDEPGYPAAK